MTSAIAAAELAAIIAAIAQRLSAECDNLNRLDAALGDGDHGSSISAAFTVAVEQVEVLVEPSLSDIWLATAKALMNHMGGASGAIFGTFFLKGVSLLRDIDSLSKVEMESALQAGLAGLKTRGKAVIGDKTMVDALEPAVEAFAAADDYGTAWGDAAEAARLGAAATSGMVARQGRAKYLGERGIGHIDPGAKTIALIFEALDIWWKERG